MKFKSIFYSLLLLSAITFSVHNPFDAPLPGHETSFVPILSFDDTQTQVPAAKFIQNEVVEAEEPGGMLDFIKTNAVILLWGLIALVEVVTRLTPTTKDDTILTWIKTILDAIIPNKSASGGTHP